MKKLAFSVLFATAVLFAGCISIPKPDWQPGTTAPAPIVGVRPTCTLPAQWAWNNIYSQWVCVVPPPVYYYPAPVYYGPVWYGPPVIIHRSWPRGHRGYHW